MACKVGKDPTMEVCRSVDFVLYVAIAASRKAESRGGKQMAKFQIDTTDLYWIDGSMDNPEDLCLHGHVITYIGEEKLEYDCTVSATALYLLKTLTEDRKSVV